MALKVRQEEREPVNQDQRMGASKETRGTKEKAVALWLGILISGALVIVCYGFAVRLPFFFDDLPKWTWLSSHDLVDIWTTSSENAYYRPLVVTIYKLGQLLPAGRQQVVLHTVSLLNHWLNAVLVMQVVKLMDDTDTKQIKAVMASILYALFPFLFRTIPWVSASFHLVVISLTLVATYAALRAERDQRGRWWGISLLATALAPLAHESGFICGALVGGLVLIQYGFRAGRRRLVCVILGGLLNVGAMLLRGLLPGTGAFDPDGLNSWYQNIVFSLHGLIYPVGPAIGWLAHHRGRHDFTMVQAASAALGLLLAWLAVRERAWKWIARALWWWFWGMLPAVVTFKFGGLVNSPRFYALAGVGIVMLWVDVIVALGQRVRLAWAKWLVWSALLAAIAVPNLSFLLNQRQVHLSITHAYQQILDAAANEESAPLGFVNVPAWLTPKDQVYALTKDGAIMLPLYTNVWEFIGVNLASREADNVMFVHTLYEPEDGYFGYHGEWLDWEQMRQFAIDHRTVWQTRYKEGLFTVYPVGSIEPEAGPATQEALARFEGGPVLESASLRREEKDRWAIELTWLAHGPIEGSVFVHVLDSSQTLATQVDGAALGGMVPLSLWQQGDRIYDVRHVTVPKEGGPYRVLVGVYEGSHRFPAFKGETRYADDAVPAVTIIP